MKFKEESSDDCDSKTFIPSFSTGGASLLKFKEESSDDCDPSFRFIMIIESENCLKFKEESSDDCDGDE